MKNNNNNLLKKNEYKLNAYSEMRNKYIFMQCIINFS